MRSTRLLWPPNPPIVIGKPYHARVTCCRCRTWQLRPLFHRTTPLAFHLTYFPLIQISRPVGLIETKRSRQFSRLFCSLAQGLSEVAKVAPFYFGHLFMRSYADGWIENVLFLNQYVVPWSKTRLLIINNYIIIHIENKLWSSKVAKVTPIHGT